MPDDNPPLLDVARVRAALAGTRLSDVRYVGETRSTNDDAAALLGDPGAAGTTFVAEFQSAGRGRKSGRSWDAPAGSSLLFTTILPEAVDIAALWAVPFWAALAVADGVEEGCGARLELRWPNDLDLGGRKAGGILCASRIAGISAFVACGVGLNVRRPPADSIRAISPPPAYLSDIVPQVERETVLAAVLGAIDGLTDALARPDAIARAWEERAALRGRRYRLQLDGDDSIVEGPAVALDAEGGLIVETATGNRTVHLADARVVPS